MKSIFSFFFFFILLAPLFCQNHDYFWPFGYNAWTGPHPDYGGTNIDFNEEPPLIYKHEREMNIDATMVSACDSAGNLLFYTNGIYIADALDDMMENGDSLNPGEMADDWAIDGYPVVQSEIVLPMPGQLNLYNLFHLRLDYHPTLVLSVSTLYRTIIDMGQNGGLGKVLTKNEALMFTPNGSYGTITAVKHANGRDWWVFVSNALKNIYFRYLLTQYSLEGPAGITLMPAINEYTSGIFVFSPNGKKMVRYEVSQGKAFVYDFDRCAGTFSNPTTIPMIGVELGNGVSISPNSRYLYLTSALEVFQFDLEADSIAASKTTVAVYDGYQSPFASTFFLSQLGPDGRIYLNCTNGENVLHVINRPNFPGDSCGMAQHGVQLLSYNSFTMPHFPNYRLGPLDDSPCDTLGLNNHPLAKWRHDTLGLTAIFTDNSFYEPTGWLWDFGDGGTSAEINPVHGYAGPGTYTVCLTVSNQYGSDTMCRPVAVDGPVAVSEQAKWPHFVVYPNPAGSRLFVHCQFPAGLQNARISIADATARVFLEQAVDKREMTTSINTEGLPNGLYFVQLTAGGKKILTEKLVVLR